MLDTKGYRPTIKIRNIYCYSTAVMVKRTLLNFALCYIIFCFFFLLCGVLWCECDATDIIVVLTEERLVLSLETRFS